MKTFLVPTDFSMVSDHVLDFAKEMAKTEGAKLVLVYVHPPQVMEDTYPTGVMIDTIEAMIKSEEENLEKLSKQLQTEGFDCDALFLTGIPNEQILEAVDERKPDCVIMGRTGKGGFMDRLFGSTAKGVAMNANCPVIVVPGEATIKKISKIAYATQLEFDETEELKTTFEIAKNYNAEVSLFKVNSPDQPDLIVDEQFLSEIKSNFKNEIFSFININNSSVVDGIASFVKDNEADLLVMTARYHSFLDEIVLPSNTKKIILRSHTPLLILHSSKPI